jgi:hypothetical protein
VINTLSNTAATKYQVSTGLSKKYPTQKTTAKVKDEQSIMVINPRILLFF